MVSHGFLLEDGKFTAIEFPGATGGTVATGINAAGQVVGFYLNGSGPHGFSRAADGTFKSIDLPGAIDSSARGINNRGDITGQYTDGTGVTRAFLLSDGVLIPIDSPGSVATYGRGVNDRGIVVGNFIDGRGVLHAFMSGNSIATQAGNFPALSGQTASAF